MTKIPATANHTLATLIMLTALAVIPSRLEAQTTLAGGVVKRQGTVESIDYAARIVTIRSDAGPITVSVPVTVTRFNNVKVGDIVTVTYDDRITARLKPASEPAIDSLTTAANLVPNPGPLPSGWSGSTRTVTMTIRSVDPATRGVTYTDTQGRIYYRALADTTDPALLAKLSPGDRVDVTWNNTASIDVQTPAPPQAAGPEPFRNRFTFGFTFGLDNSISGKMITAGTGTLGTLPISLDETSFDDVYGRIGMWRLSAAYRLSPRSEIDVAFVKASSESEPVGIGQAGSAAVTASFTDYSYWGFEVGQRFFFTRVRFTPFVGYYVGFNRFKTIDATFTAPATVNPVQNAIQASGEFYDESWAFSFAPNAGFLVGLGPVEGIAQIDLRYIGELSDAVPLADAGLRDINQESSRWSIPFTFGIRFRF